ncbi:MAG TPA: glycoside hydrolase family 140 protein [Flavilitoribacter sp.]|nr:glycoside hydrolase family 140 protein [Flavilitoribacter sp.]HMQ88221.1 glycoside hydrolase family 140 protein [Flavilitoribacter sp.]
MTRRFHLISLLLALSLSIATGQKRALFKGPSVDLAHGQIRISAEGRHFVHADGTPFFWLGDTAWELFHRLSLAEAGRYLEDRRSKGFNVIQAVVLADLHGLSEPNPQGHTPLFDNDPARPDEAYFKDVDQVVNQAEKLGMYIGMLPTWGDKFNKQWGFGPEIFTPENARVFGEFLGKRYKDKPVIWILGGDRIPETEAHFAIIRAMAQGLRAGDGGNHLITYHTWGENSSSRYFHQDDWLDFNMIQSGHAALDLPNFKFVQEDYGREPAKPVVDGEPRYEDHPVNWDPRKGFFNDFDVRQAAYWAVLSGAAGHTYGNHCIWQMCSPDHEMLAYARYYWYDAMQHPGAVQMGYMRRLFESRPFQRLHPDQRMFISGPEEGPGYQCGAIADDGSFLVVYSPLGETVRIRLDGLAGDQATVWVFDPRTGKVQKNGTINKTDYWEFDLPGQPGRGNDWVIVVDSKNAGFPGPPAKKPYRKN